MFKKYLLSGWRWIYGQISEQKYVHPGPPLQPAGVITSGHQCASFLPPTYLRRQVWHRCCWSGGRTWKTTGPVTTSTQMSPLLHAPSPCGPSSRLPVWKVLSVKRPTLNLYPKPPSAKMVPPSRHCSSAKLRGHSYLGMDGGPGEQVEGLSILRLQGGAYILSFYGGYCKWNEKRECAWDTGAQYSFPFPLSFK